MQEMHQKKEAVVKSFTVFLYLFFGHTFTLVYKLFAVIHAYKMIDYVLELYYVTPIGARHH